ncbi:MAG: hypothetical protein HZC28_06440, partial [Spirochaetes bacterium]|nr:hypothetical protein [Spirochaetota bacterium]
MRFATNTVTVFDIAGITNCGPEMVQATLRTNAVSLLFNRNIYWADASVSVFYRTNTNGASPLVTASGYTLATNNNTLTVTPTTEFMTLGESNVYYVITVSNVKTASNAGAMPVTSVPFAAYTARSYTSSYRSDWNLSGIPGNLTVRSYLVFATNIGTYRNRSYFVGRELSSTTASGSNFTLTVASNALTLVKVEGTSGADGFASAWTLVSDNDSKEIGLMYYNNFEGFAQPGVDQNTGIAHCKADSVNIKSTPVSTIGMQWLFNRGYTGQYMTTPTNSQIGFGYSTNNAYRTASLSYGGKYTPQEMEAILIARGPSMPYNYFSSGFEYSFMSNVPAVSGHIIITNGDTNMRLQKFDIYSNGANIDADYPVAVANNTWSQSFFLNGQTNVEMTNVTFRYYTNLPPSASPYTVYAEAGPGGPTAWYTVKSNVSAVNPIELTNGWDMQQMSMGVSPTNISGWMKVSGTLNLVSGDKFGYYGGAYVYVSKTNYANEGGGIILLGTMTIADTNTSTNTFDCWVDPYYSNTNGYFGFILDRDG